MSPSQAEAVFILGERHFAKSCGRRKGSQLMNTDEARLLAGEGPAPADAHEAGRTSSPSSGEWPRAGGQSKAWSGDRSARRDQQDSRFLRPS